MLWNRDEYTAQFLGKIFWWWIQLGSSAIFVTTQEFTQIQHKIIIILNINKTFMFEIFKNKF